MFADRLFNALERNDPAPGQLLISAPGMLSPEFARSVILVIEHNDMMTFGVDLTKRSEVAIFNVLPEWLPVVAKPQALYIGGPLNQQSVVGLAQTNQGVDPDKHDRLTRLAPRLAQERRDGIQGRQQLNAFDGAGGLAGHGAVVLLRTGPER